LLAIALAGFVALFRMLSGPGNPTAPLAVTLPPAATSPSGEGAAWAVFFTRPEAPEAATLRGGPDAALARAITSAGRQVDVAAYDLNLWSIRDALLTVARRGVPVRVVAELDHLDRAEFQDLLAAGIPVVGDEREGLMQ